MSKDFGKRFSEEIDKEVDRVLFERKIQKERKIIFDYVKHLFNTCDHVSDLIHNDQDLKEHIELFLKTT